VDEVMNIQIRLTRCACAQKGWRGERGIPERIKLI